MGVVFAPWSSGCGLRLRDVFRIKNTLGKSAAKATHEIVTVSAGNRTGHLASDLTEFTEDNLNKLYSYGRIIAESFLTEKHQ